MVLEISSEVLARLMREARELPNTEVCGLLLGSDTRIAAAEACANVAAVPARAFEIDPAALFAAHRRARAGGMPVVGCYHSHPTGDPVPSAIDAASAMGDGAIWLIFGGNEVRAWQTVEQGAFIELTFSVNHAEASP